MPNNYIITKTCDCSDELVYWNVDTGWTLNFDEASLFPRDIIMQPLPQGSSSILEVTEEGEPMIQYSVIPLPSPVGGIKIF
jgi:hypothetical protein